MKRNLTAMVLAALSLAGCGHDRRQKTVSAVRMAVPLSPITYLPVYLGRELGYYAEQGLDVELQDFPGGSKALQAMFGGSADVCACVYEQAIQLTAESAVLKAMRYMQVHSPEEIRSHMPAQYRVPDESADLEALRATIPMLSQDGRVTLEEAEAVKSVLALSAEKVRAATFDLASTYTNEFVASR